MMKWFRKYNRHLLAGLVVFLMVAFLIQDSLSSRAEQRRFEVWGTFHGQEIRTDVIDRSRMVQAILGDLGIAWNEPWSIMLPQQYARYATMLFGFKPLTPEQFALLRLDAIHAGVEVGEERINDFINRLPANLLGAVRQHRSVSVAQISEAVRDFFRVATHADLALGAVQISDAEVRHMVRDTQDRAEIAYVAFPADAFIDEQSQPSDAELEAQFQKYRDAEPSTNGMGFSYRWPPRVMIETASVQVADVAASVTVTEEQARAFYRQNKARYSKPRPPASQPEPPSALSSQPASASAPAMDIQSFREVRADIERELRDRAARSRAREIAEQIASEAGRPWDQQKRDKNGYAERPAGVDAPGYLESFVQPFAKRAGVSVQCGRSGLLSREDLQTQVPWKRIRPAREDVAGQLPLAEAAFRVPGSYDASKVGETELRLSLFQPSATVYAEFNDLGEPVRYLALRVVEWRAAQAPGALAEVRERVLRDLRRQAAMTKAAAMAQRLYAAALVAGLKPALDHDPELHALLAKAPSGAPGADGTPAPPAGEPYRTAGPLARRTMSFFGGEAPTTVPGLGASEKVINGIFEMCESNWTPAPADAAATQPSAPATQPAPKVRVVELPESHQYAVVELLKHEPVRQDQFKAGESSVRQQMIMQRRIELMKKWFDPQTMFARIGFEPAQQAAMESDDEG